MPEWLKGADCKSVANGYVGSNPSPPTSSSQSGSHVFFNGPGSIPPQEAGFLVCPRGAGVAHLFGKEEVMGPNPIVGSITFVDYWEANSNG